MISSHLKHIILFGPPGVGKGAQAKILSERFHLTHLSTGDLLRDEIKRKTELGRRVEAAVGRGEFADDETVLGIILASIDRPQVHDGFVMDGFPRNVHQAERFDAMLGVRAKRVDRALFIDAPERVILERLGGRRICNECGATYHVQFKKPRREGICDVCGGRILKRHDDNPEVHRERLETYYEKTRPLEDFYRKAGILSHVNGNQSIEDVAAEIARILMGKKD
jgi:adenylate kinase